LVAAGAEAAHQSLRHKEHPTHIASVLERLRLADLVREAVEEVVCDEATLGLTRRVAGVASCGA